ncbi:cell adhesion molecule CEACAM5 [Clarias gariepinus]|uniref:carcinoembryonic antigen-related cell adhesion molecule 5 n=1 Tax=Clarias gariepinus TaxID=13013 RepID=UPI00234C8C2E|nr:carcinoembryonic antigen-related cell adhesion molecule 5 [Clarias gariepinus]
MDLYSSCVIVLLLAQTGFCSILPAKVSGVRGKNVNFTLASIPPTYQFITWTFEPRGGGDTVPVITVSAQSERVAAGYVGRVTYHRDAFTLELSALTPADSGHYSVNIMMEDMSTVVVRSDLTVLEPVADVNIISSVSEPVEINSTVTLTCVAKGSALTYSWMNNSVPVVADGTHITQNGSQLNINGVFRTDLLGPITCTAKNQLESSTSDSFNLTVSYGPELIKKTQDPLKDVLKKGSNLTFTCSAMSSPAADFIWLFNGVTLPQKTSTLAFSNVEVEQSGNYSCMAYNSKTLRHVSSDVSTVSIIEAISGTNITGPNSPLIAGNSTVNLTCTTKAGKADEVLWSKDGKPLSSTQRVMFSLDKSVVAISPVQKGDAGVYKCELKNKISSDVGTYPLMVNYGPDDVAIKGDLRATVGQPWMINCSYASVPPPTFVWKFNGTALDGQTNSCLMFPNLEHKDSGIYTCEASNPMTGLSKSANHTLTVREVGEKDPEGLSSGAIAGIVIAVLLVLAIIIWCCIKKKRKHSDIPSPY